ncbi:hypothetical protein COU49_00335 [Candidatus Nomurabacteria bacterium CG10_big_fil_rev_8_21_14_0_10_35_16]|uniref:RNA polymerase sigma factor n=1 Tax=Candidatus Nomurabacteria bacterium CG10_big_fil_rev_8_21_14_0_10_35_16 TaxID=1974731 RepID=A0A2H0TC65_9BACT|nr:MAG: hypothetical protein COU49_00335 [Candidatus Nomurabacteria bacterium CG10_big_fil_rev_8_21_14_0_10_35_16]
MNKSEERELIQQAKKDPEAFGAIFDAYYDQIFGYVLKRVGDVHLSQDITADTFFKALDRLWQFRWRNISILSWLYRIATNETNQYFRGDKKRLYSLDRLLEENNIEFLGEVDIMEEIINQEKEMERAEDWIKVRKLLKNLPEKYQEVVALRYFEDKKISEISEILGKKEGTIKSLLSRAMDKMQL